MTDRHSRRQRAVMATDPEWERLNREALASGQWHSFRGAFS